MPNAPLVTSNHLLKAKKVTKLYQSVHSVIRNSMVVYLVAKMVHIVGLVNLLITGKVVEKTCGANLVNLLSHRANPVKTVVNALVASPDSTFGSELVIDHGFEK